MSPSSPDLRTRILHGPDALERLGSPLDELLDATAAPVTARRPWLATWVRSYPGFVPWVIALEDGGGLAGAALLARSRSGLVTRIVALGHGVSDYARLPVRDDAVAPVLAAAIVAALGRLRGPWSLRLQLLPVADPVLRELAALLRWSRVIPADGAPRVFLGDDRNPRAYLTRNGWQSERAGWNRMRREGLAPAVRCVGDPAQLAALLPALERIRRRRDAAEGRHTALDDAYGAAFWRAVLLELAERAELDVLTLELVGEIAAYAVCIRDGGAYRFWDGRFEPAFGRFSPGRLILLASLRKALADETLVEYDWMWGMEPYKLRTATDVVEHRTLLAWSSPAIGALASGPRLAVNRLKPGLTRHPQVERSLDVVRAALRPRSDGRPRGRMRSVSASVLVTDPGDAQARSAVAAVRGLAAAGYRPVVAASGPHSLAAASRDCAARVDVPAVADDAYVGAVRDEMERSGHLTVIPSSDDAVVALQAPGHVLVDKVRMMERAERAGIPTPPTRRFGSTDELTACAGELAYPVVVKPATRTGGRSRPPYRADSPSDLQRWSSGGLVLVQPFIEEPLRSISGVVRDGRFFAVCHQQYVRTWPPGCGTSSAAVTTEPDLTVEPRLLAMLEGFDGIFQAQFAGAYLLDLNPRVYGSLPLAIAAGSNLVAVHCDLVAGRAPHPVRARPAVFYRWIEGDLRALGHALRERHAGPLRAFGELLPHPGAAHSTESLRDPGPMMMRLRYALTRKR